jgi:hypothetical protein
MTALLYLHCESFLSVACGCAVNCTRLQCDTKFLAGQGILAQVVVHAGSLGDSRTLLTEKEYSL